MMILETALGDVPYNLIVSIPAALAVIYVVRLFLSSQREWKEDLRSVVETATQRAADAAVKYSEASIQLATETNKVIDRNTQAMDRIHGIISNCYYAQRGVDK